MSKGAKEKLTSKAVTAKFVRIAKRYKKRLEEPGKPTYGGPTTNAGGDLRIQVYKLGRKIKGRSGLGNLGVDPFPLVLVGVFAELRMTTKNDRNRARLIAKELRYADQHNVPSKYLIGFIHQVGGRKAIERLENAKISSKLTAEKHGKRKTKASPPGKRAKLQRRRRGKGRPSAQPRRAERKWSKC